jgi:predicted PurR-regulated permease PerM
MSAIPARSIDSTGLSAAHGQQREGPADVNPRSVALTVLAVAASMVLLKWAQEVFIPIVLSIVISYALEPTVAWMTRVRIPRVIAAGMVVGLVAAGFSYSAYALADNATAIVAQLPDAAQKLRLLMRRGKAQDPGTIEQVQQAAAELQKTADEATGMNLVPRGVTRVQVVQPAVDVRQYVYWGSTSAVAFIGQAVLVTFFVFFLLASGDLYKRKLVRLAGPRLEQKRITVQILDDIDRQIERFLLVRIFASAVVGVASWMAFRFVGLEQAAAWGIVAGVFNSIPYFGPVIVAVGTIVVGFLQFGTVTMALYVSGLSMLITSLEGWLLTPWLTSRASRTNEVAVFVALIFWSFVWGIWGTLLAVPMLVILKVFCDRIENLKPIGELLGD